MATELSGAASSDSDSCLPTLSHSLLPSLSDLFSPHIVSALFMLTSWSKTKLTPHCVPCLTKAPLPVVWDPPQEALVVSFLPIFPGAPNSDHQLQPPVCSLKKRSHSFYLYVGLSFIPSTCITLLHLCWIKISMKFFQSTIYWRITLFTNIIFPSFEFLINVYLTPKIVPTFCLVL